MFDSSAFIGRLEKLMDEQKLSASAFADTLGVQRSGISHILSGRNKPGLEFILKITDAFPDTDLYWLLKGTERHEGGAIPTPPPPIAKPIDLTNQQKTAIDGLPENHTAKLIVLHADGTFSEYTKRL